MMGTLSNLLRTSDQDKPAIIIPSKPPVIISHFRLGREISTCQQQLRGLGICNGDKVALFLPNSLEFVVSFLAIINQHGVAVSLNPTYKEDEANYFVEHSNAVIVIAPLGAQERQSPAFTAAKEHGAALVEVHWDGQGVVFDVKEKNHLGRTNVHPVILDVAKPSEDDVMLVLHTSGTTATPKAVPLTHENLSTSIKNICHTYSLTANDRTMLIMPLYHIHGLFPSLLCSLAIGGAVIIPPRLGPSFWTDFNAHGATWYTATPTMHQVLLAFPPPEPMPPIRFIRSSSSPLSPQILRKMEGQFATPVLDSYAMTESTSQVTLNPLPPAQRVPGSVGIPHSGVEIQIRGPEDTTLNVGEEGEVCIRGPNVMNGYLSDPEANARAFTIGGFFRTGDYGKMDMKGFLFITGPIKDLINKGGEKIGPVELDHFIEKHPAVAEAVSFAIDDDMYGQDIGAAVRLKPGESITAKELQKWMKERIAAYKVPKKIWFSAEIPKTPMGKISRKLVAESVAKDQ